MPLGPDRIFSGAAFHDHWVSLMLLNLSVVLAHQDARITFAAVSDPKLIAKCAGPSSSKLPFASIATSEPADDHNPVLKHCDAIWHLHRLTCACWALDKSESRGSRDRCFHRAVRTATSRRTRRIKIKTNACHTHSNKNPK